MVKSEDKAKALESVLSNIQKNFGAGAIMKLGDRANMKVETIPTGALTLDLALGGGLPKGRIIELFGDSSAGKSTLTLHVVKEVQKLGGTCAFIDAEHAIDPKYAADIGVNVDELLICQPTTSEEGLEVCDQLVKSGQVDLVVIDSVAALVPRAELEGEMGDNVMGVMARMMSQACRKLTGSISSSKCVVIFINQTRQKIGVVYGDSIVTTGGNALKFYSSVRLKISRTQTLKKGTEEYGIRSKVKVVKNKVAPPFKEAEFDILFGQGISTLGCIVDLAEELNIVTRRGAWYSYEGENVAQGRDKLIQWLTDNPEKCTEIESMVKMMSGIAKEEL